jgi:DNA-binding beta-propeller fold protein YncE
MLSGRSLWQKNFRPLLYLKRFGGATGLLLAVSATLPTASARAAELVFLDNNTSLVRWYDLNQGQERRSSEIGLAPSQMRLDGTQVFVLDGTGNRLYLLGDTDAAPPQAVRVPANPADFVVGRERIYVVHGRSNRLTVLNRKDLQVVSKIDLGPSNSYLLSPNLALDESRSRLWITDPTKGLVRLYDTRSLKETGNIPLGDSAFLAPSLLDTATGHLLVAMKSTLYVLDGETTQVQKKVSLQDPNFLGRSVNPGLLALDAKSGRLYVGDSTLNQISVVDLNKFSLISEASLSFRNPISAIDLDGQGNLYISHQGKGEVTVINPANPKDADRKTIKVGKNPTQLRIIP